MGLRRWVQFLLGRSSTGSPGERDSESLVLWEQKTFGGVGPCCSVPTGKTVTAAVAYTGQSLLVHSAQPRLCPFKAL